MMTTLATNVLVSSTHRDDGEFVDAVAYVSVEEDLVRTVEMAEPCCELARSANLATELLKLLKSYPSSKYACCTVLGGVGRSGGEDYGCHSLYSTLLGCFSYHPSCADSEAFLVPS